MLVFIGLGLNDEKDISVKGLEFVKSADVVYLENYTSRINCSVNDLEKFYGKKIVVAGRDLVESKAEQTILKDAKTKKVVFLVGGDPFAATTHVDLLTRAKEMKIETKIVHNASIISAIGVTGLQVYKFGKTTSIPFPTDNFQPETAYDVIKENKKIGLHTLALLDVQLTKYMIANEAIKILLDIENKRKEKIFIPETFCIVVERLGSSTEKITSGTAKQLLKHKFGEPLHSLIIPGKMHFVEEEVVKSYRIRLLKEFSGILSKESGERVENAIVEMRRIKSEARKKSMTQTN